MTNSPKNSVQKALPFKNKLGFTALPNEIFHIYVSHPKFNGNCVLVYMCLLDHYNEKEKYAWPTQDQIADATFISRKSVRKLLKTLEEVELIRRLYNADYGNHAYIPLKPVSTREEFEAKFPLAVEKRRKFEESREADKADRGKRQADFRAAVADLHATQQN